MWPNYLVDLKNMTETRNAHASCAVKSTKIKTIIM